MKYIRYIIYSVLLLVQLSVAHAQSVVVLDSATNKPIVGAHLVDTTYKFVIGISDENGFVSVNTKNLNHIKITAVGYRPRCVSHNKLNPIDTIYLSQTIVKLDEVSVGGLSYLQEYAKIFKFVKRNYKNTKDKSLYGYAVTLSLLNDTIVQFKLYHFENEMKKKILPINELWCRTFLDIDSQFLNKHYYFENFDSEVMYWSPQRYLLFNTYYNYFYKYVLKKKVALEKHSDNNSVFFSYKHIPEFYIYGNYSDIKLYFNPKTYQPAFCSGFSSYNDSTNQAIMYRKMFDKKNDTISGYLEKQFCNLYSPLANSIKLNGKGLSIFSVDYSDEINGFYIDKFLHSVTRCFYLNKWISIKNYTFYLYPNPNVQTTDTAINNFNFVLPYPIAGKAETSIQFSDVQHLNVIKELFNYVELDNSTQGNALKYLMQSKE